jgi:hypothetical protein
MAKMDTIKVADGSDATLVLGRKIVQSANDLHLGSTGCS